MKKRYEHLQDEGVLNIQQKNDKFFIGTISGSSQLKKLVREGKLDSDLPKLSYLYRSVYGGEPWKEYLFCGDCKTQKQLPDGMKSPQADQLIIQNPEDFCCPECKKPMETFYDQGETIEELRQLFQRDVVIGLLFENEEDEMLGFSMGEFTTAEKGYQDKIIHGRGDTMPRITVSFDEYLRQFEETLKTPISKEDQIFNIAEWGVLPEYRKSKVAVPLMHALNVAARNHKSQEASIRATGHTLVGSPAEKSLIRSGFIMGTPAEGSPEVQFYTTVQRVIDNTYSL